MGVQTGPEPCKSPSNSIAVPTCSWQAVAVAVALAPSRHGREVTLVTHATRRRRGATTTVDDDVSTVPAGTVGAVVL